jgi:hypothetical protein
VYLKHSGDFVLSATDASSLADTERLRLLVSHGPIHQHTIEIGGMDRGLNVSGFQNNFALHTLEVGGETEVSVRLEDGFDNTPHYDLAEVLYAKNLIVHSGSIIDLNHRKLYCQQFEKEEGAYVVNGEPTIIPSTPPL